MALSTSIPIATMKAPREMRCRVLPASSRMGNDTAMLSTRLVPMIMPPRKPYMNMRTMMTMSTDSRRLTMKPLMAEFTWSGWKKILSVAKPTGTRCITSAIFSSTALPTSGTMTPSLHVRQMPKAGLPLRKKPPVCGSL